MASSKQFFVGDPVPDFACPSSNNAMFHFDTCAGRYLVLSFFGSAADPRARAALVEVNKGPMRALFDDRKISFFGISIDPVDEAQPRIKQSSPGIRYFWDFAREVSTLYGALDADGSYRPFTLVLDPAQRVIANIALEDAAQHNQALEALLNRLPEIDDHAGVPIHAPVLIVPRVFEPGFCRQLIGLYEQHGGTPTGVMREKDGKTVGVLNNDFKRRKDFTFETDAAHEKLRQDIATRFRRRLVPEIRRAFQFEVTHIERYLVACYEGEEGGFFRAHRDNTTKGTAHRRFACTLNLNTEEYEGGDLRFPEFGRHTYRAPMGGAVIFSCSLLHEATPVTAGRRYAFLPFLYDAAASEIRRQNAEYLTGEVINQNP